MKKFIFVLLATVLFMAPVVSHAEYNRDAMRNGMPSTYVTQTASLSAQNTFSDPIKVPTGPFRLVLSGTWSATVTLQYSPDNSTWYDSDTFTSNGVWNGEEGGAGGWWRAGVKTGNYASGAVVIRLEW